MASSSLPQENLHDDKEAKEHMHMPPFGDAEKETHLTSSQHEEFRPCIRSSVFTGIGHRPSMEDTHVAMDDAAQLARITSVPASFYAVFDGHGGKHAAEFARDHLFSTFLDLMENLKHVPDALTQAFLDTDIKFASAWLENKDLASGTTAVAAVIVGSKLYVANAGDCRAVLCRNGKALDMSLDHDPRKNRREYDRIIQAGGFVDQEGYLNGMINMSRGIGNWDREGLKGPFIALPEIMSACLTEEDEFMIVASDGLFRFFLSQDAVDFVRAELEKHHDLAKCAHDLAHHGWRLEYLANFFNDNSTIVVVSFRNEVTPSAT